MKKLTLGLGLATALGLMLSGDVHAYREGFVQNPPSTYPSSVCTSDNPAGSAIVTFRASATSTYGSVNISPFGCSGVSGSYSSSFNVWCSDGGYWADSRNNCTGSSCGDLIWFCNASLVHYYVDSL